MKPLAALFVASLCLAQQPNARPSAEWVKSGVIYEINPRTFSPGGNFRGIEPQLPRLKQLGVTILWLMPIHPVGQLKKKGSIGSPYAVRDYMAINPDYGTAADLKHLVRAAHDQGFKIIIDIVANHTAWDSVLMKHPEYYKHDTAGKVISPVADWADVAGLNYDVPGLRSYMLEMLNYWLREFDLDGFRCDVAFMVPVDFWEEARRQLERIKPEIVMIAEAHEPKLLVKAFDLDYAWPFHSTLTDVFENGSAATALRASWDDVHSNYPKNAMEMRFSDNHDEKRAIARFGERGALAASALVFTMDGVPMLYNGMEVGDTTESGAPALFEKLPVFWEIAERHPEFVAFYSRMIALRRAHAALQQGETEWIGNSAPDRVLTYTRRGSGEEFVIAINCSNEPFFGTIEAAGPFEDVTPHYGQKKAVMALPALSLDAWGFRIFKRR
ncbi:MAG TPA: alpha-amylase family glycosyl hydrolase [Bryobacteraceae bacterium]|nr:alpha-amylase family glycosyl hydrolase [Bryobacteraceae bacterium]